MYFDIYFIMIQKSSSYFQIFRHMLSIAMVLHRENTIKSIAERDYKSFSISLRNSQVSNEYTFCSRGNKIFILGPRMVCGLTIL